ncbi:cyclic nucleotide-binding domain-containing protein [Flavobacterium rakeshii]|uniref:Cyclic nucleotide-binding domain-containing protein n=1 Tax=Flavobacterium rakeshii TaxID=1038845 RepID=A0A6N8HCH9_9FLAO|nr:Crp/Fnr family transcriptional regulator [Flavobacterium rakeshii]MUV03255.1 cyclic nucleotide-binding domain-containing protein [Flavobacterium rakeshii]
MNTLQLIAAYDLEEITVPPKTILLNEGEKSHAVYFVKSGCLRMWFNNNGNEITTQFFFEGKAIASMESLLKNEKSDFTLESIEQCTLFVMPKNQFKELLECDTEFKKWFDQLILNRFFYYSKHLITYLKDKPQDRYNELLEKHPHILQRVPQHYIASYLGITPVSLSRIRNRK